MDPEFDILNKRIIQISLAHRHAVIQEALYDLMAVSFRPNEKLATRLVENYKEMPSWYYPEAEDEEILFCETAQDKLMEGEEVSIFHPILLRLVTDDEIIGLNIRGLLNDMARHIRHVEPVPLGGSPNLGGLLDVEVAAIINSYDTKIAKLSKDLEVVYESVQKIMRYYSAIPPFLETATTDFFGTGDFINHRYEPHEFKRYASVQRHDENGRLSFVDLRTPIMTSKWWYPLIGDAAKPIDSLLTTIREESAPLAEQPTLKYLIRRGWARS